MLLLKLPSGEAWHGKLRSKPKEIALWSFEYQGEKDHLNANIGLGCDRRNLAYYCPHTFYN